MTTKEAIEALEQRELTAEEWAELAMISYQPDPRKCHDCGFTAKNPTTVKMHRRHEHPSFGRRYVGPSTYLGDPARAPRPGRLVCVGCGGQLTEELGEAEPFCMACAPCDQCPHSGARHMIADTDQEVEESTCYDAICLGCQEGAEADRLERQAWSAALP